MAAADALAGEAAAGTLRGLLLAPVSRLRLVGMKAFGVLVVAVLADRRDRGRRRARRAWCWSAAPTGWSRCRAPPSGVGGALGRIALVVAWTVGQLAAIGAVALAVSAWTEHPLVVLASVLGMVIVFGVLGAIPALDWLQPYLLTSGWTSGVDVLRDPLPARGLVESTLRALCYLALGSGAHRVPDAAPRRLIAGTGAGWPHGRTPRRRRRHRRAGRTARMDPRRRRARPHREAAVVPRGDRGGGPGRRRYAEPQDHHPDIDIRWRTLTFRCSTHSKGGITELDVELAAAISAEVQDAGGE